MNKVFLFISIMATALYGTPHQHSPWSSDESYLLSPDFLSSFDLNGPLASSPLPLQELAVPEITAPIPLTVMSSGIIPEPLQEPVKEAMPLQAPLAPPSPLLLHPIALTLDWSVYGGIHPLMLLCSDLIQSGELRLDALATEVFWLNLNAIQKLSDVQAKQILLAWPIHQSLTQDCDVAVGERVGEQTPGTMLDERVPQEVPAILCDHPIRLLDQKMIPSQEPKEVIPPIFPRDFIIPSRKRTPKIDKKGHSDSQNFISQIPQKDQKYFSWFQYTQVPNLPKQFPQMLQGEGQSHQSSPNEKMTNKMPNFIKVPRKNAPAMTKRAPKKTRESLTKKRRTDEGIDDTL